MIVFDCKRVERVSRGAHRTSRVLAQSGEKKHIDAFNLGTGQGVSVLQMISAASEACGMEIPYRFAPHRTGDIATCYADATKAKKLLHWSTEKTLQRAMQDSWRWQSQNPHGFASQRAIVREERTGVSSGSGLTEMKYNRAYRSRVGINSTLNLLSAPTGVETAAQKHLFFCFLVQL